jgi:hypothetical protein
MSNKRVSQRLILQSKFLKISDEFIMVCKYIFFEFEYVSNLYFSFKVIHFRVLDKIEQYYLFTLLTFRMLYFASLFLLNVILCIPFFFFAKCYALHPYTLDQSAISCYTSILMEK